MVESSSAQNDPAPDGEPLIQEEPPETPPASEAEPDPAAFFAPAPEPAGAIEPEAQPEPEPTREPEPEPQAAADPAVAATLHVPASGEEVSEGGEWELLLGKVRDWFASGQLQEQFNRYRSPLQLLGLLFAIVVVLRIYGALLGAIDSLPLVPGLLELAGVIWLSRFAATRLVRSSDRQELIAELRQRWQSFRGRS
jgi:hypothetical protein